MDDTEYVYFDYKSSSPNGRIKTIKVNLYLEYINVQFNQMTSKFISNFYHAGSFINKNKTDSVFIT